MNNLNLSQSYTFVCPRCGQHVKCNAVAFGLLISAGACQACRLQDTMLRTDGFTNIAIAEYMGRTNSWPEGGTTRTNCGDCTDCSCTEEVVH